MESKLIDVMKEYTENVYGMFPGNAYWSKRFEEAYLADLKKKKVVELKMCPECGKIEKVKE